MEVEEGARSSATQAASEVIKGQKMILPLEPLELNSSAETLILAQ